MASNEMKVSQMLICFVDLQNVFNQEKAPEHFARYFVVYSWGKWK